MPPSASLLLAALAAPLAGATTLSTQDMLDLSLEQLSNIVITSVSRQEGRLSTAPASLYIISAADIRRSGARSLPEALRLAPNLQVARVDARNYAVTARGFNSAFENKLLVLIDGRSVYTPLFSGVFWDAQDVVMEDIARIEVISGPGATIWGVNAVNGVINVITKPASQTQGGLASATAGEHERHGQFRYGGQLANGADWRAYAKADQNDDTVNAAGAETRTGWRRSQAGFRSDYAFG
ncbi:MAG: TonB-dependent receptor plug domain-containing protein, partial [Massilia sp.]|nr:TonB-dependent receptor plug domain-containing protein [Massilia sp.]